MSAQVLADVTATLQLFCDTQLTEIRALAHGDRVLHSAVYRDLAAAAREAECLDEKGEAFGTYFVPNAVSGEVLKPWQKFRRGAVTAESIERRRWLLIDADPVRASGDQKDNSTDDERAHAWAAIDKCRDLLEGAGLVKPVVADSGNGYHVCYPIDLPVDQASYDLVADLLAGLQERCGTDAVGIDQRPKDAPRIWKLYGTWSRKGPETEGRPHRQSWIVERPEVITAEDRETNNARLERLVGLWRRMAADRSGRKATTGTGTGNKDMVERARAYAKEEDPAVSGQKGHDRCYHVVCTINQGFDLNEEETLSALQDWNARCSPPWSEKELRHKIAAALKAACPEGRGYLARQERAGNYQGNGAATVATNGAATRPATGKGKKGDEGPKDPGWQLYVDDNRIAEGDESSRPAIREEKGGPRQFHIKTFECLDATEFPPPAWVIPGIMSEGLNILAGAPKQGKSLLALNLALTIAGGGVALGNAQTVPGDVLYLSLEDMQRRVQARARSMLRGLQGLDRQGIGKRLAVVTEWQKQDQGGLAMIDAWALSREKPTLLIIDVWNRFAPATRGNHSAYAQDADAMSEVKKLAERRGFTAFVIHHTRKAPSSAKEPDDFVSEVSGTMGLSGTADGIMVLLRSRHERQAALHVTGRDTGDQELVLEFEPNTLTWRSLGTASEHMQGRVQQSVIQFLRTRGDVGASAPEVADALGEKPDSVRRALNRMLADRIVAKKGNLWRYPFEAQSEEVFD